MTEIRPASGPADEHRPQDILLYKALLSFTKQRLLYVDEVLAGRRLRVVDLQAASLQIRMSLEHLVLSTLVANRPGVAAVSEAFNKKDAGEARAIVKRINPKYWPIPFDPRPPDSPTSEVWQLAKPEEPYLREEQWGKVYGYCSSILHAPNPYTYLSHDPPNHKERRAQLAEHSRSIQRLIKNHQVYISELNHSFICHVPEDPEKEPTVDVWIRQEHKN